MIKLYDLKKDGTDFKADFNWNYDLIKHIIEIRTKRGYLKIDLIKDKKSKMLFLSKRVTDFVSNRAVFEIKGIGKI